jgi:acetyl-CoA C-acetyltransferase
VTGAFVHGVGTSRFGVAAGRSIESLAWEAAEEALRDAELEPSDIDAIWVGTVFGPAGVGPRIARGLGLAGVPVLTLEAACASGTVAFHEAVRAVASGRFRHVLAIGVEHLSSTFDGPIVPERTDAEGRTGLLLPALYALQAVRWLAETGEAAARLAWVSVKNKRHGLANDRAHLRNAPTHDEVLASRPVVDPLTLLQCCPMTDGAAAAVVGPAGGRAEVAVRSIAMTSGRAWGRGSGPWSTDCVARAGQAALEQAGVSIRDIDVLEVHDAFTIGEVLTLEALGAYAHGDAARAAEDGRSAIGGDQPVNPSGGLLSRGHPLGATGLAQVAEITWQLRAYAGPRQVEGATLGLVETMGGGASGVDGNAAVVSVMERVA